MADKLTDRLRGRYEVGPDNMYGTRDFSSFIPPICLEAADRIEVLEKMLKEAIDMLDTNDAAYLLNKWENQHGG